MAARFTSRAPRIERARTQLHKSVNFEITINFVSVERPRFELGCGPFPIDEAFICTRAVSDQSVSYPQALK